jgi:serine phosphatase RsbU (regulator of sigma subunit)
VNTRVRQSAPALSLIGLTLAIVIMLAFGTANLLRSNFDFEERALQAVALSDAALRLQLDEETGVRGYAATHDASFLRPYRDALPQLDAVLSQLDVAAADLGIGPPSAVATLRTLHDGWLNQVARPLVGDRPMPESSAALERRGKDLIDRYRSTDLELANGIQERIRKHAKDISVTFALLATFAGAAVLLGCVTLAYVVRNQARLASTIDRQRSFVDDLQRVYISRQEALPGTKSASAYISATHEASVGGDLFDVRRLDDEHGYLLIADVSGKGVSAAVDTAKIRFTISALAKNASEDPVAILTGLNRVLNSYQSDIPRFATVFYGVLNWKAQTLRYASAGHSSVFLRRGADVRQLAVTGPLVGIGYEPDFETNEIGLEDHDLLVLATDGLTEARGADKSILTDEGAMQWIREADGDDPKRHVEDLLARLRAYSHSEFRDDLALLVLQIDASQLPVANAAVPQARAALNSQ